MDIMLHTDAEERSIVCVLEVCVAFLHADLSTFLSPFLVYTLIRGCDQSHHWPFIFSLHIMLLDVFLTAVALRAELVHRCRWK